MNIYWNTFTETNEQSAILDRFFWQSTNGAGNITNEINCEPKKQVPIYLSHLVSIRKLGDPTCDLIYTYSL